MDKNSKGITDHYHFARMPSVLQKSPPNAENTWWFKKFSLFHLRTRYKKFTPVSYWEQHQPNVKYISDLKSRTWCFNGGVKSHWSAHCPKPKKKTKVLLPLNRCLCVINFNICASVQILDWRWRFLYVYAACYETYSFTEIGPIEIVQFQKSEGLLRMPGVSFFCDGIYDESYFHQQPGPEKF